MPGAPPGAARAELGVTNPTDSYLVAEQRHFRAIHLRVQSVRVNRAKLRVVSRESRNRP